MGDKRLTDAWRDTSTTKKVGVILLGLLSMVIYVVGERRANLLGWAASATVFMVGMRLMFRRR
jgi:hypothetical protein